VIPRATIHACVWFCWSTGWIISEIDDVVFDLTVLVQAKSVSWACIQLDARSYVGIRRKKKKKET
jgi:hypothetical protein